MREIGATLVPDMPPFPIKCAIFMPGTPATSCPDIARLSGRRLTGRLLTAIWSGVHQAVHIPFRITREAGLRGQLRDTLRHRTWCTQRYVHITVVVRSEPTRDHRVFVTYPHVVRVRPGAGAAAVTLGPDRRDAPARQRRADSRVAGELMQGLGSHCRRPLRPLGHHSRGGLPGSDELPYRVVPIAAHNHILSPVVGSDHTLLRLFKWPLAAAEPGRCTHEAAGTVPLAKQRP